MTQFSTPRLSAPRSSHLRAGNFTVLGAALVFVLAGCAGGASTPGNAASPLAPGGMSDAAPSSDAALSDGKVMEGSDSSALADSPGASIIRSSDLVIEVTDPQTASDEVSKAIEPLDGRVEFSSVSAAGDWSAASASLTVRVPANRLEDAITVISGVGEVVSVSRSASDVTLEHQDLSARVAALETSTERLRGLMAEASNTAELLAAESALTERQAQLDGLASQLKYLDGQVDEATITVSLNAPGTAPAAGPTNFWDAILLGISSLGAAIVGFGLGLGVALPWIVALAIIAGAMIWIVRAARRRGRARRPGR